MDYDTYRNHMDYQSAITSKGHIQHIKHFSNMGNEELREVRKGFYESMNPHGANNSIIDSAVNPAIVELRQATAAAYDPKTAKMDLTKISAAIDQFVKTLTPTAASIVILPENLPKKWEKLAEQNSLAVLACAEVENALRSPIPERSLDRQMQ